MWSADRPNPDASKEASVFDVPAFRKLRAARGVELGEPLVAVAETTSTNDLALGAADAGARHGALFIAEEQTKGRGRHGHTWTSPPGENLTFSVVLRPGIDVARASGLALVVGLAVRSATARRVPAARVAIKWPNDVVVGTQKLAGILVESRLKGMDLDALVAGIGINVGMRSLPEEIRTVATSLALLGDPSPNREAVLVDVLAELEPLLDVFRQEGLGPLLPELREHDALAGVQITAGGVRGTGAGIDADGALMVRDADRQMHRVTAGSVERE
jgi:BirA family transcriptional regulator, biotin operon repressor / biotin---[acetyl-CoA-carboxylase] ligase